MIDTDKKYTRITALGDVELRVAYDTEPGSRVYVQYFSPRTYSSSMVGYELLIDHEDLAALYQLLGDAVREKGLAT